jgi:hypothetical protein
MTTAVHDDDHDARALVLDLLARWRRCRESGELGGPRIDATVLDFLQSGLVSARVLGTGDAGRIVECTNGRSEVQRFLVGWGIWPL